MSWLDTFFGGYNRIQDEGANLLQRQTLNFLGATVTDDTANARTNVEFSATGLGVSTATPDTLALRDGSAGFAVGYLTSSEVNSTGDLLLEVPATFSVDAAVNGVTKASVDSGGIKFDVGSELTTDAGMTLDGVLLKDQTATVTDVIAPDDEDGLNIKTPVGTLFNVSYQFGTPLISLAPAHAGGYLYAPTTGQGWFFAADAQVSLIGLSATSLLYAQFKTYKFYDDQGNKVVLQLDADANPTDSLSYLRFGADTQGLFGWIVRSGTGAESARLCAVQAAQGQAVSGGTNNNGHDLNLRSGDIGSGGSAGAYGGVVIGLGTHPGNTTLDMVRLSAAGGTTTIGCYQSTTIVDGLASGRSIWLRTFGAGAVVLRGAGGVNVNADSQLFTDNALGTASTRTNASTGTTKEVFGAAVTRVETSQESTTAATGARNATIAQESTHASGVGGALLRLAGKGTVSAGNHVFGTQTGATDNGKIQGVIGATSSTDGSGGVVVFEADDAAGTTKIADPTSGATSVVAASGTVTTTAEVGTFEVISSVSPAAANASGGSHYSRDVAVSTATTTPVQSIPIPSGTHGVARIELSAIDTGDTTKQRGRITSAVVKNIGGTCTATEISGAGLDQVNGSASATLAANSWTIGNSSGTMTINYVSTDTTAIRASVSFVSLSLRAYT